MKMTNSFLKEQYIEFKTELEICKIGGLFLALYSDQKVCDLVIEKLKNDPDLKDFFQFSLWIDKSKLAFPILFDQTFQQMGKESNIFHVLGIENLSAEPLEELLGYLQYARERFKSKPYSIVFWITPELRKKLFFKAPDFHHWVFGTYDFTNINEDKLNSLTPSVKKKSFDFQKIEEYLKKGHW